MNLILAITGASGVQYGLRILEQLVKYKHEVDLIVSDSARKVMSHELSSPVEPTFQLARKIYDLKDIGSSIASGTSKIEGMIIAPCSMKTLAAIASGYTENLIHRAADVMLKENRKLLLLLRETPLHRIHLENMLRAKDAGAIIMPASPGYYYNPKTVDDLINFITGKVLNLFDVDHDLFEPWDPDFHN
jgi:4-hydroxy-3-polyprenylbenzoate decarboxylase